MGYLGTFFLWFFVIYGIFEFFRKVIFEANFFKGNNSHEEIVLIVGNHEDVIEPILRIFNQYGFEVKVITRNSTDDTVKIVRRLSEDMDLISIKEEIEGHQATLGN